jgi:hypothetical protein
MAVTQWETAVHRIRLIGKLHTFSLDARHEKAHAEVGFLTRHA